MTPNTIQKIRECRESGLSYGQIAQQLSLPITTVRYHANGKYRQEAICRSQNYRIKNPLQPKVNDYSRENPADVDFTLEEAIAKLMATPYCYLTGTPIDFTKPETYSIDHIIPISQGGKSNLANMALICRDVNQAKADKTPEEFLELCSEIIKYKASR